MTHRRKHRLSFSSLEFFLEEFDSVRALLPEAFVMYGDDEDDDASFEAGHIESAEVEVALSALVSTMGKKCELADEPSSLSELFEEIFSPDDELVSVANNLEEAINGYFGELFGEDLALAKEYMGDIFDNLSARRDKWSQRRSSQQRLNLE